MGNYMPYVQATGAKHYLPTAGTVANTMHFGGTYLTGSGPTARAGLAMVACPGIPGDVGQRATKYPEGDGGAVGINNTNITVPVSRKTEGFSVMAWILCPSGTWPGVEVPISSWGVSIANRNFTLENHAGIPKFHLWRDGVGARGAEATVAMSTKKWHCVVGTMASAANGYDMRCYVDGVEVGYYDETAATNVGTNSVYLGRNHAGGGPSNSQMAHHAWWPRELSALDIKGLYQAGMTGPSE